jgi:polysaccharide biosynthesis protein PelG
MAGIGFELRNFMAKGTLYGVLKAYGFSGLISSGPWVLSIMGILMIGFLDVVKSTHAPAIAEFQISVTYLMASSLIVTGPIQLMFSRFVADRLYQKDSAALLPNLNGLITLLVGATGCVGILVGLVFFQSCTIVYDLLMLVGFVTLCMTWVVVGICSGLKDYRRVLWAYTLGYGTAIGVSVLLSEFGVEGLLAGFDIGHILLFWILFSAIIRSHPSTQLIAFDFLRRKQIIISLGFTGLFYNFAIWADKLMFWFNENTSVGVIGPLRASEIYDLPIFLAHMSIVPGMAVFLLRIETDFVERHAAFYDLIQSGANLRRILQAKDELITCVRGALIDIVKIQGFTVLIAFLSAESLLQWFGISPLHKVLLKVDVLAAGLQVLLLAVVGMLFYFDQRRLNLIISAIFALANVLLTALTQVLGPAFYGYGFALSVAVTAVFGLFVLSRKLEALEYETFMLQ